MFYPESDPRETYRPRRKRFKKGTPEKFAWVAPEHVREAASMERDFPRDDWGVPLPNSRPELVVDKRPRLLVPPRPTYLGTK